MIQAVGINELRNRSVFISNGVNVFAWCSLSAMTESRLSGSRWCKQDDFRRKAAQSAADAVTQVCQCLTVETEATRFEVSGRDRNVKIAYTS